MKNLFKFLIFGLLAFNPAQATTTELTYDQIVQYVQTLTALRDAGVLR